MRDISRNGLVNIDDPDETSQRGVELESKKKKRILTATTLFLIPFMPFRSSCLVNDYALRVSRRPRSPQGLLL